MSRIEKTMIEISALRTFYNKIKNRRKIKQKKEKIATIAKDTKIPEWGKKENDENTLCGR